MVDGEQWDGDMADVCRVYLVQGQQRLGRALNQLGEPGASSRAIAMGTTEVQETLQGPTWTTVPTSRETFTEGAKWGESDTGGAETESGHSPGAQDSFSSVSSVWCDRPVNDSQDRPVSEGSRLQSSECRRMSPKRFPWRS
jgi:hypothetical protein